MNKATFAAASTAIALFGILSTNPATLAEESSGRMVDDSGLVISSNADGSLKEFYLAKEDLAALKILPGKSIAIGPVLKDSLALSIAAKQDQAVAAYNSATRLTIQLMF